MRIWKHQFSLTGGPDATSKFQKKRKARNWLDGGAVSSVWSDCRQLDKMGETDHGIANLFAGSLPQAADGSRRGT